MWAKVGHAVPEPGFAPGRGVRFEYRAVNEMLLIAAANVDTKKEETDRGRHTGATHVG